MVEFDFLMLLDSLFFMCCMLFSLLFKINFCRKNRIQAGFDCTQYRWIGDFGHLRTKNKPGKEDDEVLDEKSTRPTSNAVQNPAFLTVEKPVNKFLQVEKVWTPWRAMQKTSLLKIFPSSPHKFYVQTRSRTATVTSNVSVKSFNQTLLAPIAKNRYANAFT